MLDKLAEVEKRYVELERMMSDPKLLNQQREYSKFAKERSVAQLRNDMGPAILTFFADLDLSTNNKVE